MTTFVRAMGRHLRLDMMTHRDAFPISHNFYRLRYIMVSIRAHPSTKKNCITEDSCVLHSDLHLRTLRSDRAGVRQHRLWYSTNTDDSVFARLGTDYKIRNQLFFAILEALLLFNIINLFYCVLKIFVLFLSGVPAWRILDSRSLLYSTPSGYLSRRCVTHENYCFLYCNWFRVSHLATILLY